MRASAWRRRDGSSVPAEDRPRIFALALSGYVGLEGKDRIVASEFDGMLRRTAQDETDAGAEAKGRDWLYEAEEGDAP